MQTRTLYALTAAALIVASGAALAETTDASSPSPAPASSRPDADYALKITPNEAWIKDGEAATFSVVAQSRAERTLTLTVRAAEGLGATLASTTLDIMPGSSARTALRVTGPENATRSPLVVVVTATDEAGVVREAKAAIHLRDVGHKPSPAAAKPTAPAPNVDVLKQILERLDAMEKRISKLERDRPAADANAKGVRMTLSPEHAILPPEGGKVALLLAGGAEGGRVALGLRHNESAGWRVALEKEQVHVGAGERAWVWIHLTPPAMADAASPIPPLEYAVVQLQAPGDLVARGTATVRMP